MEKTLFRDKTSFWDKTSTDVNEDNCKQWPSTRVTKQLLTFLANAMIAYSSLRRNRCVHCLRTILHRQHTDCWRVVFRRTLARRSTHSHSAQRKSCLVTIAILSTLTTANRNQLFLIFLKRARHQPLSESSWGSPVPAWLEVRMGGCTPDVNWILLAFRFALQVLSNRR